jgi:hypothetical protein
MEFRNYQRRKYESWMKINIRIGLLSTIYLSAFLVAATVVSDFSRAQTNGITKTSAAAIKTGEWIGHIVVDKISAENCSIEFENIKAHFSNRQMVVSFRNNKTDIKLNLSLDKKNAFSIWHELSLQLFDLVKTYEREFKFSGEVKGNILTGSFFAEVTRAGDTCGGDMYFVKKGTLEAKAFLTNRDVRVVRLEHRLEMIEKNPSPGNDAETAEKTARLAEVEKEQKLEAARLENLKAEAERKIKELAALQNQPAQGKNLQKAPESIINFGTYHALIVGISKYQYLPKLRTAVADANAMSKLLRESYGFKITKLIDPSRADILDALDEMRSKLKFKDNLLIYYAGHGWLDKQADEGYWLPVNAKPDRRSRWMSNGTLTAALRAIKAKHIMVVADSCYSGRLVRDANIKTENSGEAEYLQKMSCKKARVVLTSGGLEPVEDGNGSTHSPFATALLAALEENKSVIDGTSLFNVIRRPVMVNANQTPQYSDLRRAGHDGGDFLFIKKSWNGN